MSARARMVAGLVALSALVGCTSVFLLDPTAGKRGAGDRAVQVVADLCTESASEVRKPMKLLFAMDTSQSMAVTDPEGTRARAFVDLLETLPDSPDVEIGVLLFAGDVLWLTAGGTSGFVPLPSLTAAQREQLAATILTFAYAGAPGGPNRDTTDFVKPLDEIFATISRDIAEARASDPSQTAELARYTVLFLSDGHPRENQDAGIFARCASIRGLRAGAGDVTLHTVHVFLPEQPVPTSCPPGQPLESCQARIIEADAQRLRRMAEIGGGEFRSFRNGEPINFLTFRLGGLRRGFVLKQALVFNLNAPPGSAEADVDSDGDGLSDAFELALENPTDPLRADSDGDGFSDGVEQHFRERGGPFRPEASEDGSTLDRGCPEGQRGVDADRDGLLDCDEQLLGTASNRFDSDNDGVPDLFEWLGRGQAASADPDDDPDRDGLGNAAELRMHLNPLVAESADYADRAYRYRLSARRAPDASGRVCYRLEVDNVLLVPTLDTGLGPGVNHLWMSLSEVASDDPDAVPRTRVARFTARYPLDGIKDPPDGVIVLTPDDFVAP